MTRLGSNGRAQLDEYPPLDFENLFLRVEDLGFVLFQFGRSEALCIYQRLLALEIRRDQVQIRPCHLDVVAEDGIEFNLERADAGSLPLAFFDAGDVQLAVAT